mmetsp:Transcript_18305/g.40697  ORF Transcript_18305/g.40697 Transcript_18305/m.40697 type:complete len:165 (+) Transcript_18305:611-1105(+)
MDVAREGVVYALFFGLFKLSDVPLHHSPCRVPRSLERVYLGKAVFSLFDRREKLNNITQRCIVKDVVVLSILVSSITEYVPYVAVYYPFCLAGRKNDVPWVGEYVEYLEYGMTVYMRALGPVGLKVQQCSEIGAYKQGKKIKSIDVNLARPVEPGLVRLVRYTF